MAHFRWVRWTLTAGVAALFLFGLYFIIQHEISVPTVGTARTPLPRIYGSVQNTAGGMYLTPVGTASYRWDTSSETSPVYGPVAALSDVLNLSSDQGLRITAVQQKTQQKIQQQKDQTEKKCDALFRKIRDTQQSAGRVLPFSDPLSQQINGFLQRITRERRERQMKALFSELIGETVGTSEKLKSIEKEGIREIEAALDEKQKAALPRLLDQMRVFRAISFEPAERYVALRLSNNQFSRLELLSRRVKKQSVPMPMIAPYGLSGPPSTFRRMPRQQRASLLRQQQAEYFSQLQSDRKAWEMARRQARREALLVLTAAQRQAITHPNPITTRHP